MNMDRLKIGLAFVCIALGVWGYYYFSESAMVLRILMVLAGLLAAGGVAWLSAPGKEFFAFAQEAWAEAGRVAWPTRKEFVVVMALFLFGVDMTLQWIIKVITGRTEG
jgi:preprotein translocase subunit SecE